MPVRAAYGRISRRNTGSGRLPLPRLSAAHRRAVRVLAYYPADALTISGDATRFERTADSGNGFESFFCPKCGSTVYVHATARPEMIGLAVGTMADPAFKAPINSVWEEAKHHWVTIPGEIQHFPQARQ